METQNYTPEFLKQFGIFVGLYNKLNNTSFTVKAALKEDTLVAFFQRVSQVATIVNTKVTAPVKKSTKRRAYDALNMPEIDSKVLEWVHNNQDKSRADIAAGLGIRLSTVCGAINRLIAAKKVFVSGEGKDEESNRSVELIGSIYLVA